MINNTKLAKYYKDLFDNANCAYKIFTDDFCTTFTNLDFNVNDAMILFDGCDDTYEDDLYALNALIWKDIFIFPLVTIKFVREDLQCDDVSLKVCKEMLGRLDEVKPLCETKRELDEFYEIYSQVLNKYQLLKLELYNN